MSYFGQKDYDLELAAGRIPGKSVVNKFGRAPEGVQLTETDIWDRADGTGGAQDIWVAPTVARIHDIASTSTDDDGSPVGVGARTVEVFGLTSWDANEVSEIITLNGTTNVPTVNAYVIVHRMEVLTWGATSTNVGVITATAQTDATITAQINVDEGQTQMAIYGVPSTKVAYMTQYYYSNPSSGTSPASANGANVCVHLNKRPDVELTQFVTKHTQGISNTSTSYIYHPYRPYLRIDGPAIIKLWGTAFSAGFDVSGGFDLIMEDA